MTLEGKLSNNVAPIQSLTLDDHYLVAGSRDRNVRVSHLDCNLCRNKYTIKYYFYMNFGYIQQRYQVNI